MGKLLPESGGFEWSKSTNISVYKMKDVQKSSIVFAAVKTTFLAVSIAAEAVKWRDHRYKRG
jgi:hypothetical protein